MSGYNVLVPDTSRDTLPELALPAMDALQQLGHTPVVLEMASMAQLYRDLRLQRKGGYELFLFYAKDTVAKGNVDFAFSCGLSGIMEDTVLAELHYLPEELGTPGLLYLPYAQPGALEKLESAQAGSWKLTTVCSSSRGLVTELLKAEILARYLPLAYSPRVFYPAAAPPVNAAYPLKQEERLTSGFSVSFAGRHTRSREDVLRPLAEAGIELAIFGDQAWAASSLGRIFRGAANRLTELNSVHNASELCLDLPLGDEPSAEPGGRVVEILGSGAFLLSADSPGVSDYAASGVECATCNRTDLTSAVCYWLGNPTVRHEVAAAGLARARAEHTWAERLKLGLSWLELGLLTGNGAAVTAVAALQ